MIIKVCGLCQPENIREIVGLDISWTGFIFWHKSKRAITVSSCDLPNNDDNNRPEKKRVGVFVNASIEEMIAKAADYRLDYLQLHGDESPALCRSMKEKGFAIIKAFPVSNAGDLSHVTDYEGTVDYFLFDTRCDSYGGSGKTFDWSALQSYQGSTPFLLSGGINPSSIEAIRNFHHPSFAGIDLNSGFETQPGIKDAVLLGEFINKLNT